jgi:hypothetical protein
MLWINEREVPEELLALLDEPSTPKELWILISMAQDEVKSRGAVTYPTKANIETMIFNYSLKNNDEEDNNGK